VVVYWAAGCHLCEPAKTVVRAVADEHGVGVREVDITGDPELEARYRTEIPVVEVDGRKAFKYVVDASALARRLRAAAP
jgi:glutaredoxin